MPHIKGALCHGMQTLSVTHHQECQPVTNSTVELALHDSANSAPRSGRAHTLSSAAAALRQSCCGPYLKLILKRPVGIQYVSQ